MQVEHLLGRMRDEKGDAASCEERIAALKITHNGLGDNNLFHTLTTERLIRACRNAVLFSDFTLVEPPPHPDLSGLE
jgi:hypothetical protein